MPAGKAIRSSRATTSRLDDYADAASPRYAAMVERIRQQLGLTTLQYQTLADLVTAIGLPREKLCTYCWNGESLPARREGDNGAAGA